MYSMVQTAVRLGLGLVNTKIAAVFLGPVGVGMYGQFWSLFGAVSGPLVAPVATVLTRSIASAEDDELRRRFIGQTIRLCFLLGIAIIIGMIPFAGVLSEWLFFSREYELQVIFAAVALLPLFLNTTLSATARGYKLLGSLTVSELLVALSGTLAVVMLIPWLGIEGAFWSVALAPFIASVFLLVQYRNSGWLARVFQLQGDRKFRKDFLHFFGSALITTTTIAVVPILIRNGIANQIDLEHVGYWQAGSRLSDLYMTVFASLFAMHYLPRFAEIKVGSEILAVLLHGARILIPVIAGGALLMYLLLDILVPLLYTPEFLPLKQIMGWQLAGVVLQAVAWYVRYVMVARGMAWWVAATDIVFSLVWLGLAMALLPLFGLVAVSMAYFFRYLLDLVYSTWKCQRVIQEMDAA